MNKVWDSFCHFVTWFSITSTAVGTYLYYFEYMKIVHFSTTTWIISIH